MRVLHVISSIDPRTGGTATAVLGLLEAQRRAGIDVSLIHTFGAHEDSAGAIKRLETMGIGVKSIGPATGRLGGHATLASALRAAVAATDVVHVHAVWEEIQFRACQIARKTGVKYVISPHGMMDSWSLAQGKWKKKLYLMVRMGRMFRGATAVHFTTQMEFDRSAGGIGGVMTPIIEPLGVDLSEFASLPEAGAFRRRWPAIGDRRIVLFLGRLHPKKGLELLIPAFKQAGGAGDVLMIAGPYENEYRSALERLIGEHGISDRVIFTGMLHGRERFEALVDAYVFVLPSYQENFGLAVVEALACACPVIVSDQVNIFSEIVAGGVGGVVETRVESVAAELGRWLGDRELRERAAGKAGAFVREEYDWRRVGEHWVEHYGRLK